jgi:hypothetical protein
MLCDPDLAPIDVVPAFPMNRLFPRPPTESVR